MDTTPDFETAVQQYRGFLSKQGVPGEPLWIFREDVLGTHGWIRVKMPLPSENSTLARRLYMLGQERGLGISIEMLCLLDAYPCSYVRVPEDKLDAEQAMMSSGLKLCIPTEPIHAQAVHHAFRWKLLQWNCPEEKMDWMIRLMPSRIEFLGEAGSSGKIVQQEG